jgi:integrase
VIYYRNKNEGGVKVNRRLNVILNPNGIELLERLGRGEDNDLIFPRVGKTTANVSKHWKNICGIAGISKKITSGAFRHMKGEQMNRDGATPWEIANQMGHSSLEHIQRYTARARANSSRVAQRTY